MVRLGWVEIFVEGCLEKLLGLGGLGLPPHGACRGVRVRLGGLELVQDRLLAQLGGWPGG